jgi:hypothetical protein
LVNTGSNDFSGYLDKFRITTGIARYTNASYITQSSSYPTSTGFLAGSNYCNSNILNIRFANDYLTGSNLILPSGTNDFTSSQDILVTNITGTVNNNTINTISSGSNIIKRNDGITDKTIYTGDNYVSSATINAIGTIDKTILNGSSVVINTDTNNFIPSINKTFTYEVDYNAVFNQEIDSVLTIVTTYSLPLGFSISSDAKRIIGYVNFSDTKTIKLELSDSSTYNIVLKPIFFKKKYTY